MVRIWLTNTDYLTCIINVNLSKAKYCCDDLRESQSTWLPPFFVIQTRGYCAVSGVSACQPSYCAGPVHVEPRTVQSVSTVLAGNSPLQVCQPEWERSAGTEASRRGQVWREVSVGLHVVSEWCGPQPAPASLEWCQYWPAGSSDIIQLLHWLCLYMMIQ